MAILYVTENGCGFLQLFTTPSMSDRDQHIFLAPVLSLIYRRI